MHRKERRRAAEMGRLCVHTLWNDSGVLRGVGLGPAAPTATLGHGCPPHGVLSLYSTLSGSHAGQANKLIRYLIEYFNIPTHLFYTYSRFSIPATTTPSCLRYIFLYPKYIRVCSQVKLFHSFKQGKRERFSFG